MAENSNILIMNVKNPRFQRKNICYFLSSSFTDNKHMEQEKRGQLLPYLFRIIYSSMFIIILVRYWELGNILSCIKFPALPLETILE